MPSLLCNITHPELQITAGLARSGSGTLFPYHPEFYDKTTGLYGPGSIILWYLLQLSVILSWSFPERYSLPRRGAKRVKFTSDLLGALAFPIFAATDILVQVSTFSSYAHRASAYLCLRAPQQKLLLKNRLHDVPIDLREPIPPELLALGQQVVNITGPVSICYFLCCLCCVVWMLQRFELLKLRRPIRLTHVLTHAYLFMVLATFHITLASDPDKDGYWISPTIFLLESMIAPGMLCGIICIIILVLVFFTWVGVGLFHGPSAALDRDRLQFVLMAFLSLGTVMWLFYKGVRDLRISILPDLGISLAERDQIAAVIVGVLSLGYTIFEILVDKLPSLLLTERGIASGPVVPKIALSDGPGDRNYSR